MSLFKEFFCFNSRERRASLILVCVILAVIAVRIAVPEKKIPIELYELSGIIEASGGISDAAFPDTGVIHSKQAKTDLNLSDSAELVKLPGIGPVLASRIIKYRNLLGGFVMIEQLNEVYGIDTSLFHKLSERISVDTSFVKKIYVNLQEYIKHPYLTQEEANAINALRKQGIRFNSVSDLVSGKIISEDKARKLRYYFDFSY